MSGFARCFLVVAALVAVGAAPAGAQENVEAGKSPAQLYASDCAICHKSPNGLTKAGGLLGLQSFLREHYTASRESAAAIAQYLRTVDKGPPPPDRKRTPTATTRSTKDEKPKSAEKPGEKAGEKTGQKTGERRGKAESGKPTSGKPSDKKKPAEGKPAEPKPAESKPAESKPVPAAAPKPPEKPPEAKPAAAEPAPSKPAESKPPESKPADSTPPPADKPAKSD